MSEVGETGETRNRFFSFFQRFTVGAQKYHELMNKVLAPPVSSHETDETKAIEAARNTIEEAKKPKTNKYHDLMKHVVSPPKKP